MNRKLRPACPASILLLPLVLGACAGPGQESESSAEWNLQHMRYERALELASQDAREHPEDAAAQELHRRASVAALLERARRLTFEDEDVQALGLLQQALELEPDAREIRSWIDKTQRKLCDRWLQVALERHTRGELESAIDAYEQSLRFQPGHELALNGMDQAVREVNHRELLSREYFDGGVHALSDYWLERARSLFAYSNKYRPGDEHTGERTRQVHQLLAAQRARVAQELEKKQLFGAARNEYRMAMALAPGDPSAEQALVRCTREVEAQRKLEAATYQLMRGQYERAGRLLDEGEQLTLVQKDLFEGTRARIQEQIHQDAYEAALALERDQRFPEAIEKYRELLKQAEFYKDAFARIDTLEQYVTLAGELYRKAQEAPDDKARLDYLQQIRVFWPEYRDVARLAAELEAKLGS